MEEGGLQGKVGGASVCTTNRGGVRDVCDGCAVGGVAEETEAENARQSLGTRVASPCRRQWQRQREGQEGKESRALLDRRRLAGLRRKKNQLARPEQWSAIEKRGECEKMHPQVSPSLLTIAVILWTSDRPTGRAIRAAEQRSNDGCGLGGGDRGINELEGAWMQRLV